MALAPSAASFARAPGTYDLDEAMAGALDVQTLEFWLRSFHKLAANSLNALTASARNHRNKAAFYRKCLRRSDLA
jgi:hypothetical protein